MTINCIQKETIFSGFTHTHTRYFATNIIEKLDSEIDFIWKSHGHETFLVVGRWNEERKKIPIERKNESTDVLCTRVCMLWTVGRVKRRFALEIQRSKTTISNSNLFFLIYNGNEWNIYNCLKFEN